MDKKTVRLAAVMTLCYRLIFATILFYSAKESDTPFLTWILLGMMSIVVTHGLYRFIKMLGFANNMEKLEKVFANKN